MKVLFIANEWEIGGATNSLKQLVLDLKEYDVSSVVLTPIKNGNIYSFCKNNNIEVKYLKYSKIAFGLTNNKLKNYIKTLIIPFFSLYSYLLNKIALKKIHRLIDIESIDYIHTNLMRDEIGLLIAKKYKIKHIVHLREYGKLDFNCKYFRHDIYEYFNNNTDMFIAISESVKEFFVKNGLDKEKIRVIYNGVKSNVLTKSNKDFNNNDINIVAVGAISPSKGQIQIIEALNILNNNKIKLHLYGMIEEKYKKFLLTQIKKYNLKEQIVFEGYSEDVCNKLKEYDIGITSSISEAFGRVTIEYMFAKIPVIVSNTGANSELVKNEETGLIYECGNPSDLANKIKKLIRYDRLREELVENAFSFANSTFKSKHNAKNIFSLYEELSKNNNNQKMNIVVATPIYKICGRENIFRDTECVHDLIKYWKENIKVIVPYYRSVKNIFSFFSKKNLYYYVNGHQYNCDGIDVIMIDWQNIFPKQIHKHVSYRVHKIVNKCIISDDNNLDLIIVHIPSATLFINKLFNCKCKKIAVLHYTDVNYYYKKKEKFINYLHSNFDIVFCRSFSIYQKFKEFGLKNLSTNIIFSGVPITNHSGTIPNKFTSPKIKVLYVGKLIERKNLDILIKALNNCTNFDWELNIIGTGPFENKYKELSEKLNLSSKVLFLGKKEKKEVFKYMQYSDIFCMPSIRETFGLVYLEAMSNGCITIGTQGEGIDGIIKNDINGYLTNPNVEDLSNLIHKIISMDETKRKKIITEAIKTANYYNEEDMSKYYYERVKKVAYNNEKKEY